MRTVPMLVELPLVMDLRCCLGLLCTVYAVNDKQLMTKLELIANQRKDKVLYVKADGRNSYGRISKILGELDNASFLKKYILVHLPYSGNGEEF